MQLAITLLVSLTTLLLAVDAAPINYFAPGANALAATRYSDRSCEQHLGTCEQTQRQQIPLSFGSEDTQTPILKQVFTTITKKHDNLNTADAKGKKNIRIKYQTGPSVEVEGEFTKSASTKQSESDSPSNSAYIQSTQEHPYVQMVPEQYNQLEAQNYQPTEMASTSTESQPILMEESQVEEPQPEQVQDEQSPSEEATLETEPAGSLENQPDQDQIEQNPSEEGEADIDPITTTPDELFESFPESTPGQPEEEQEGSEQSQSDLLPSEDQQSSPSLSSALGSVNIAQLQPDQALLNQANGESSSNSNALSDSNQFDQAQVIDQTLYQTQPKIAYIQPAISQRSGQYKKYRKYRHRYFKLKYSSGNRY
ncbi:hypothetical protein K7432_013344 [Basidiobolus ranarum]|uniref:Uncharacterized protein n=1 Tax=Basidiobolus ranarum TaxID=34480 RepID=A0ABR2WJD9_9FUNG